MHLTKGDVQAIVDALHEREAELEDCRTELDKERATHAAELRERDERWKRWLADALRAGDAARAELDKERDAQ